jgi:hypothetical protein
MNEKDKESAESFLLKDVMQNADKNFDDLEKVAMKY